MKFFARSRILYRFLILFTYIIGIILGLKLLKGSYESLSFCIECCIFLFLIICLLILKCVIKDAQEDLAAIMKLVNESKEIK